MKPSRLGIISLGTLLACALNGCSSASPAMAAKPAAAPATAWQPWSDHVFADAQAQNKFVILDLEAVWCHWCHVMDDTTYVDPDVRRLIAAKYIAVKVDQDSRPDLANLYEDYGWPATIVFNSGGGEIAKRRGYLTPAQTSSMLRAIIDDPTPGPSVRDEPPVAAAGAPALAADLALQIGQRLSQDFDAAQGGWGRGDQKFLQWDNVEYELLAARNGDAAAEDRARQSLLGATALIDTVWGGIDQYSTDGDWSHPHFEKIMQTEAEDLRIYSIAYGQLRDERFLDAASHIHRYLVDFLLAPNGGFYTSQDADLVDGEHAAAYFALDAAGRRRLGLPRVDTDQYSRENAWAAQGLIAYWAATGDPAAIDQARRALQWAIENRSLGDGGFRHDETDIAGPYLADTLEMGRAMLDYYAATGDRSFLTRADAAGRFIEKFFVAPGAIGVPTSPANSAGPRALAPRPEVDENVAVARFANLLAAYTGNAAHKSLAAVAANYIFSPDIAGRHGYMVGEFLLAGAELSAAPLHLSIVGSKSDPAARLLFDRAARWPTVYKQVEWIDRAEPPLPDASVVYPDFDRAAAYVCTANACSSPAFDADSLATTIARSTNKPAAPTLIPRLHLP